jgi:hypothetical protein
MDKSERLIVFTRAKIKFQSAESPRTPAEPLSPELPDFSLILGGPLFQLLRRAHLSGDAADLVSRRVIALALITWLPLLALSIAEGHAWGDTVKVPFLFDVDVHARFLLALPLLILAELVVHQRMRLVVGTFVRRGLLPDEGRRRFDAAIAAAMRPAQFRAGGGAPDRVRLWTRRSIHLAAPRGHGCAYLVWNDGDWETATDSRWLVAWLRERCPSSSSFYCVGIFGC